MGFNIGKALKSVAPAVIAGPIIGGAGLLASKLGGGNDSDPNANLYKVDPNVKDSAAWQMNLYNEYKQNRPKLEQGAVTSAVDQAKLDQAQALYDTKAAANQRGLLYSGINEAAQMGQKTKSAKQLGQDLGKISNDFEAQEQALKQQAFNSGISAAQIEQNRYNAAYEAAMKQKAANQGGVLGFLGGVGTLGGGLLGSSKGSA